jgi:hypothetical protein
MKKIFYTIATALLLASCCGSTTYETSSVEATRELVYIKFGEQWCKSLTVYKYEYDGHKYILFGDSEYNNGVVHDPDCPCHNKNTNTSIETKTDSTGSYFDIW